MYTARKTVLYERSVAFSAKVAMAGRPLMTGAVGADVWLFFPIPASWSQKKRALAMAGGLLPMVKPDFDNATKSLADGCEGIVYTNDAHIVDCAIKKRYAKTGEPRVFIRFWPMVGEPIDELRMLSGT